MDTTSYSHRNGEREQPTEPGNFFFQGLRVAGSIASGDQDRTLLRVSFPGGLGFVNHGANGWYLAQFEGRWWGPVTLPWEGAPREYDPRYAPPSANVRVQPQ